MAFPKPPPGCSGAGQLGEQCQTEFLAATPDQHPQDREEWDQGEKRHDSNDPTQNNAEQRSWSIQGQFQFAEVDPSERILHRFVTRAIEFVAHLASPLAAALSKTRAPMILTTNVMASSTSAAYMSTGISSGLRSGAGRPVDY